MGTTRKYWKDLDEANQPTTLVEFRLEAIPSGTRLVISESGFSALPDQVALGGPLTLQAETLPRIGDRAPGLIGDGGLRSGDRGTAAGDAEGPAGTHG